MALTEEQADLARTVRSVLERQSGSAQVRAAVESPCGYDDKLWSVLCEQIGVAALLIPERYGGVGAGARELQVVAEELGRCVTPAPLLGSAALATSALLASGDEAVCERLLPGLAAGVAVASLAWVGPAGRWDPTEAAFIASINGDKYTVDGRAHFVLDGDCADTLLVVAHCGDELGLFHVAPAQAAVQRRHAVSMDQTRRLATVTLTGARAERIGVADFRRSLGDIRDLACAVLAAEQVGGAAAALAATVDHTKNRVQFGRPIGSFQALKHRMADLHVLVESARSACYAAGEAIAEGSTGAAQAALTAKVYCAEAFSTVAGEMIQLHGGIAITWEHDAHLYFKRAHSSAQLFGQPHDHLIRLAQLIASRTD
ncbi:MAG: acyl-CoA dehydrogenase family protein [Pseudonocardiaceae bacterium]